jgi:phytoene dehydrogenase-like protein
VGGEFVEADHVVAGAPLPALHREQVVAREHQDDRPRYRAALTGRVTVCLALRGGREAGAAHRTVVHASGDRPTVTVLRADDPALRPDGEHESVTVTSTVGLNPEDDWADIAREMVAAAESAVPGLRERLLWQEVRTPDDTLRETGVQAVPGPALGGGRGHFLPAANRSPLAGLHFAGGWSHPGGGLAHAGMSGALVAGLIVEGADFRGSR